MRDFSPIVGILSGVVGHGRHDTPVRCRVAPQLVRYQPPRRASLPLQQLAKEPFGRTGIATFLNQDVDHVPVLVHGSPQVVPFAPDLHEYLVQVPHIAQPPLSTLELSCLLRPELPAPLPDGLVGDDNPPLRQKLLHITEAQGKSMVKPNAVADDFTREPVAAVATRIRFHPRNLAGTGSS